MEYKRLKERNTNNNIIPEAPKPIIELQGDGGVAELEAGIIYIAGEVTNISLTLVNYDLSDFGAEYHLFFTSGNTPTTVEYPQTIKFPKGVQPTIESNKTYEFHIINNCLTYEWYE